MQPAPPYSARRRWAGRILSALPVLMLTFSGSIKLMKIDPVIQSFRQLGYSENLAYLIGTLELGCVAVYLIPRTAIIGAILMAAYLGGAVATHLRAGDPLLTHTVFPVYFGVLAWAGLYLRDERLASILSSPALAAETSTK